MLEGQFKCEDHDFSTNDIKKYDKHMAEFEHVYDLRTKCHCGKQIHVKPKIKLLPSANRVPTGFMCDDCKKNMMDTCEIKDDEGSK